MVMNVYMHSQHKPGTDKDILSYQGNGKVLKTRFRPKAECRVSPWTSACVHNSLPLQIQQKILLSKHEELCDAPSANNVES